MATLDGLPSASATRGKTPGAVRPARRGGKAPIFVVQRHDAAPAALRLPARARRRARELGGAEGRAARARRRSTSPCTSRTTRSTTRPSRARSRPGNYGAGTVEIWDRGTYELVEEKRDGGLTVRLHGERLEGLWTLVPAQLDGDPKNWLLVKKKEDAPAARKRRTLRADARDARGRRADGRGLALRGEVGRLPGDRDDRGGEVELRSRNDNDARRALPDGRRARSSARCARPTASSTARSCALDEDGRAELLGDAAGQARARRTSTSPSTCSRSRASRSSTCRSTERRERLARARRHAARRCPDLATRSTTAQALYRGGAGAALRGGHRQARRLALRAGEALARLAEDQDAGPAGVRDRGIHEGPGAPARTASARSCSACTRTGVLR